MCDLHVELLESVLLEVAELGKGDHHHARK